MLIPAFVASLCVWIAGGTAGQSKTVVTGEVIQGVSMVALPAGSFLMGHDYAAGNAGDPVNRYYPDEQPVHRVTLSAFQIGATEITQAQYRKIMNANPSSVTGDDLPVTGVSGNDAVKFCNLMSNAAGFEPCYDEKTGKCDFSKNGFRLPTEAEWEYACRAGTRSHFHTGNTLKDLDRAGWYLDNSGGKPHPVAKKAPNARGLFDMHGNVWEFCYDGFDETYSSGNYSAKPADNPAWDKTFNLRITRGGGFFSEAAHCRSAVRGNFWTGGGNRYTGFRVARSIR
jgi:formylglycine-generating enzyme required for sulfatase activity